MKKIADKIIIGIDPGLSGGIAVISSRKEEILITSKLINGIPPDSFWINRDIISNRIEIDDSKDCFLSALEATVIIEIPDWKNAEIIKRRINLQSIDGTGFYRGLITQYFCDRGVPIKNKVAPKMWQKSILRGIPGANTKLRALNFLNAVYGKEYLVKSGIINSSDKYQDGIGDALCIALYGNRIKK